MSWSSPLFEQIGKLVDHAGRSDAALHVQTKALASELVDNREDLDSTRVLSSIHQEVVAPNVIRTLRTQPSQHDPVGVVFGASAALSGPLRAKASAHDRGRHPNPIALAAHGCAGNRSEDACSTSRAGQRVALYDSIHQGHGLPPERLDRYGL